MARILKTNLSKIPVPRRRRILRRAVDHLDERLAQLQALHRIGAVINSTFDLEEILKVVSDAMCRDLDFDRTGMIFLDPT